MRMELFGPQSEMLIRLTVAVILGLVLGAERTRVGKRAGMRTYALVSLGAALFIVIAGMVSFQYADTFIFDPLRVASQIVVGMGFLGAGVIFVQRQELTGLTTAAGLWVVAGIGMACGYGFYTIATYVTFLMLLVFEVMWYIEEHFIRLDRSEIKKESITDSRKHKQHNEDES